MAGNSRRAAAQQSPLNGRGGMLYFLTRPSGGAFYGGKTGGAVRVGGFIAERGGGLKVNERIRAREVRVMDDAGIQLGVMTLFDAMKAAREQGLDVVEISPNAAQHD